MLFIRGKIAHTPVRGEVELLADHLVVVDTQACGRIVAVVPGAQEEACLAQHGASAEDVLHLQVRCWGIKHLENCRTRAACGCNRGRTSMPLGAAISLSKHALWQPAVQEGQFLMPGFIDTHLHAPQYAYTGTGTHIPLMEWLDTVRALPRPPRIRLPGWREARLWMRPAVPAPARMARCTSLHEGRAGKIYRHAPPRVLCS